MEADKQLYRLAALRKGASSVAAIVLAAGRGARFDATRSKLLAELEGRPLVRVAAEAALASRAYQTIVVTGHARASVEAALTGLPVVFAHNEEHAKGMASSLRVGVSKAADAQGALVLLADMPGVSPQILDLLIASFERAPPGCPAVAPLCKGRRGNPVLLGRGLFSRLAELGGDEGARRLLQPTSSMLEVAIDDEGVLSDIDTPADLKSWRARVHKRAQD